MSRTLGAKKNEQFRGISMRIGRQCEGGHQHQLALVDLLRTRSLYRARQSQFAADRKQQCLMRHSDIQTTLNIYGDVVTGEMQEVSSKVASLAFEN